MTFEFTSSFINSICSPNPVIYLSSLSKITSQSKPSSATSTFYTTKNTFSSQDTRKEIKNFLRRLISVSKINNTTAERFFSRVALHQPSSIFLFFRFTIEVIYHLIPSSSTGQHLYSLFDFVSPFFFEQDRGKVYNFSRETHNGCNALN
jgi:hypothetical protein